MRVRKPLLFLLIFAMLLSGCTKVPSHTTKGDVWGKDWIQIGNILGVDPKALTLTLTELQDSLSASGIYYAAFASGDAQLYLNSDGKEADIFPIQLYVLAKSCTSTEKAAEEITTWQTRLQELHTTSDIQTIFAGGMEYTVLSYTVGSSDSPYSRGAAAFIQRGRWAFTMELTCLDEYGGNLQELLQLFLENCHYSQ